MSTGRCRRADASRGHTRSSATWPARAIHEENVRRARERGDAFIEARSLSVLATYHLDEGDIEAAIPLLEESQRLHRGRTAIPARYHSAINLCRFARALALKGKGRAAVRLLVCRSCLRGARNQRGQRRRMGCPDERADAGDRGLGSR